MLTKPNTLITGASGKTVHRLCGNQSNLTARTAGVHDVV